MVQCIFFFIYLLNLFYPVHIREGDPVGKRDCLLLDFKRAVLIAWFRCHPLPPKSSRTAPSCPNWHPMIMAKPSTRINPFNLRQVDALLKIANLIFRCRTDIVSIIRPYDVIMAGISGQRRSAGSVLTHAIKIKVGV